MFTIWMADFLRRVSLRLRLRDGVLSLRWLGGLEGNKEGADDGVDGRNDTRRV